MPDWVSTERIAQLTGDYDPEFDAHFRDTTTWKVPGTDLGANTSLGFPARGADLERDSRRADGRNWTSASQLAIAVAALGPN